MDQQFLRDQVNIVEGFKIGALHMIKIIVEQMELEEKEKQKKKDADGNSQATSATL